MQYVRELAERINQYNDLLSQWIRIRQGVVTLNVESFPVQGVFDIVSKGSRGFIQKGVELDVVKSDAVVRADRVLTLFMINTLAYNARKFTPAGGKVTVQAAQGDDYVEISVTDTGVGLSEDDVRLIRDERVFDPDQIGQGERQGKGSGFGLMNCKGIIEKYRNADDLFKVCSFNVESTPGKGSRFSFRLPKGIKRALMLLVLLCSGLSAHSQEAQDSLLVKAYDYANQTYLCNTRGQFEEALLYADSAFDALNREVRSTETRFDGSIRNIDRLYDEYGRLKKVSLPFIGEAPLFWNTYGYDVYDRIRSIEEASGRETSYSYSGNSITTTRDNISTTKNYDALGNLISATDPAGTISYNLSADGQPSSITAPGNITTSFVYDEYRRQTGMNDPGFGLVTREYDASGNISKETFVNGNSEQYEYDAYNRLIRTISINLTTSYTYNENNELTGVSNNNGSSMSFTYDNYGNLASFRENGKDGKWLQKDYTYASGNVNSTTYTSQSGELAIENYYYSNGHLSEVRLNGTTPIFKLNKENAVGLPTEVVTGNI